MHVLNSQKTSTILTFKSWKNFRVQYVVGSLFMSFITIYNNNTSICKVYNICKHTESEAHNNTNIQYLIKHHHNDTTWAGTRRELLDFTVQGKINRGRHTDHLAQRHSIRTNQCQPPPSPLFCRQDALPAAQPTASKHWRQVIYFTMYAQT